MSEDIASDASIASMESAIIVNNKRKPDPKEEIMKPDEKVARLCAKLIRSDKTALSRMPSYISENFGRVTSKENETPYENMEMNGTLSKILKSSSDSETITGSFNHHLRKRL